tara:strand:- start:61 stop:450 length:390 start_codon:yes stop_codon:yes gene_type:complete
MINFFSKYKFIFYLANVFLIILYIYPGSILGYVIYSDLQTQPQITRDFIVSTNHVYAFFSISILGLLTFKKSNKLNILILYLIILSIILEILHLIIPERSFELADLFGNLIGVIILIIINYFSKTNENY